MQLSAYFDRIGFRGTARPDLETLQQLLCCHACAVPFENLDIQLGRRVTIDVRNAYDKIVTQRRGGWCYEQNGLFGWALGECGFSVTRLAAAVMRQERGEVANANHLSLRVTLPRSGEAFLADVGFGGSLLAPIPLTEGDYVHEPFRLGLLQLHDGYWRFWEDAGDGKFSFDFQDQPANEAALEHRCDYLQTDPSSGFVKNLVAQIRLAASHRTLRGRVYTEISTGGIESRVLNSPTELVDVLAGAFDLQVPAVADLWPRIVARHDEFVSSDGT